MKTDVVVVGVVVVPVGLVDLGVIVIKLTVDGNEVVVVKGPTVDGNEVVVVKGPAVVGVCVVAEAVDVEGGEELVLFSASGPRSLEKEG